jgi:hypothetical protein
MFGLFRCRCCDVLQKENQSLRDFIERILARIEPRPEDIPAKDEVKKENDNGDRFSVEETEDEVIVRERFGSG